MKRHYHLTLESELSDAVGKQIYPPNVAFGFLNEQIKQGFMEGTSTHSTMQYLEHMELNLSEVWDITEYNVPLDPLAVSLTHTLRLLKFVKTLEEHCVPISDLHGGFQVLCPLHFIFDQVLHVVQLRCDLVQFRVHFCK